MGAGASAHPDAVAAQKRVDALEAQVAALTAQVAAMSGKPIPAGGAGAGGTGAPLRIFLYHGYEMQGSGSNEYVRYLSKALALAGNTVHVLCREGDAAAIPHVGCVIEWDAEGKGTTTYTRDAAVGGASVTVHVLPHSSVRPVFITDKARAGNVKAFKDMTDEELKEYHDLNVKVVGAVLDAHPCDVLYTNHVVYQPVVAADVCPPRGVPFIIFPHGSAIEYTVRGNDKFLKLVRTAVEKCTGLIIGSKEVRDRILSFYPDIADAILAKTQIVGVGVDTSLFQPVERSKRGETIAALCAAYTAQREKAGTLESTDPDVVGKLPSVSAAILERVDKGEVEAVTEYVKTGYNHSGPDGDLVAKLGAIDFATGPILFFVGALTAGKGVQSLLVALPRVLKAVPTAQLVIVGSGAYREALEAIQHALATGNKELLLTLVNRGFDLDKSPVSGAFEDIANYFKDEAALEEALGVGEAIKSNVHFLGRLNHDLLKYLFPCVDIAVFPSVVPEAYPLVLMESLSNGVLPLVSNFSGFKDGLDELEPLLGKEWVDNLRIDNNPEVRVAEMARNLVAVCGNEELKSLNPRLRAIALEHYDWDTRAKQIGTALHTVLAYGK